NRVVVIDETHGFAVLERFQCAEDCSMAKALGHAARVEREYGITESWRLIHLGILGAEFGRRMLVPSPDPYLEPEQEIASRCAFADSRPTGVPFMQRVAAS